MFHAIKMEQIYQKDIFRRRRTRGSVRVETLANFIGRRCAAVLPSTTLPFTLPLRVNSPHHITTICPRPSGGFIFLPTLFPRLFSRDDASNDNSGFDLNTHRSKHTLRPWPRSTFHFNDG